MTKRRKIVYVTGSIILLLTGVVFCLFFMGNMTKAAGLVDETLNAGNLYSKYALKNYQLDFYVDTSGGWLPWNWGDSIGKSVTYGIYGITNGLWMINLYLSSATGYIIQEVYNLNFIGDMAESIGTNIQTLAGVSSSGFSSDGLYVRFLPWLIIIVGGYTCYHGMVKHEVSKALNGLANFIIIFIASTAFIAYSTDYISAINEFSTDMSGAMLDVGTKIIIPGSMVEGEDSVNMIRDSLFSVQVYQPWLLLQFGTTDVDAIGTDRIEALLSVSPSDGENRENAVINEVENYSNGNMSMSEVWGRLGITLFLLVFNIGISVFVFLLTGIMLLAQILFLIYSMCLPVSFLISMIPGQEGKWKQAVVKVFNTMLNRAGITFIMTISFCLSSMFYSMTAGYPFFLIMFLQIVTFAGTFIELRELLGMFNLQGNDTDRLGRRMFYRPYMRMNRYLRRQRRYHRRQGKNKEIAEKTGTVSGGYQRTNIVGNRNTERKLPEEKVKQTAGKNVGTRIGRTVGAVSDVPAKVIDNVKKPVEKLVDLPTNAKYTVKSIGAGFKEERMQAKENRRDRQERRQDLQEFKRRELSGQEGEENYTGKKFGKERKNRRTSNVEYKKPKERTGTGDNWNDLGKMPKGAVLNGRSKVPETEKNKQEQTSGLKSGSRINSNKDRQQRKTDETMEYRKNGKEKTDFSTSGQKMNLQTSLPKGRNSVDVPYVKAALNTPSVRGSGGRQKMNLQRKKEAGKNSK